MSKIGVIHECRVFDNMLYFSDNVLNWWKEGSQCDKVGGRDGGTLPPGVKSADHLEIFIDLMCRKINLEYEKTMEYKNLQSLRFIPPPNAMGSHQDMDPVTGERRFFFSNNT